MSTHVHVNTHVHVYTHVHVRSRTGGVFIAGGGIAGKMLQRVMDGTVARAYVGSKGHSLACYDNVPLYVTSSPGSRQYEYHRHLSELGTLRRSVLLGVAMHHMNATCFYTVCLYGAFMCRR